MMPATTTTTIPTVSETLRRAMLASGLEAAELARLGGIDQNMVGRFFRGDGLPIVALDALARGLGLELVVARRRRS